MLFPVTHGSAGDHIDLELAHELLRPVPISGRSNIEVCFVGVNKPLTVNVPAVAPTIITPCRIPPRYVVVGLINFQENIERTTIIPFSRLALPGRNDDIDHRTV
jgi:hypothetical protein